jgi:hypothetical protein
MDNQPFQKVCHPGGPSCFRLKEPPKLAMVRHTSLAVRATPGRLSSVGTTESTAAETTAVAGVSAACCAVCRSQSSRIAIGVTRPNRFHMAPAVCVRRTSMPQPVFSTVWKSSTSQFHVSPGIRSQASSSHDTRPVVTTSHSKACPPAGGSVPIHESPTRCPPSS